MTTDESTFYKIDDYLRGRLSATAVQAFESEMAADDTLALLVRQQQQENRALELLAERDLRAQMNVWERDRGQENTLRPTGGRYRMYWLRWAAAAVLIFAVGWWVVQRVTPVDSPIVARPDRPARPQTTTPKPSTKPRPKTGTAPKPTRPEQPTTKPSKEVIPQTPKPVPPVSDQKPPNYAALADEFYRESDFAPAAASGGVAGKKLNIQELLAQSLLKSRKYDAAITAFQEIANSRVQPYADRAQWALALAYLHQMPRRSGALNQVLQSITAKPGHPFYGKAKALQARL